MLSNLTRSGHVAAQEGAQGVRFYLRNCSLPAPPCVPAAPPSPPAFWNVSEQMSTSASAPPGRRLSPVLNDPLFLSCSSNRVSATEERWGVEA